MATDDGRADLLKLSGGFVDAELNGDVAFLEQTLMSDFTAIGPRGSLLSKEQWMERHRSGGLKHRSYVWDDVRVRSYGGAAVAIARVTMEGRQRDRDIHETFRCSLLYLKLDGDWRIASLHLTPIADAS